MRIDRYDLVRELGGGAFGTVYAARHIVTGRTVALKVLDRRHLSNNTIVERFLREARAAGTTRSPHIVEVFDAGRDELGNVFLAMELLEGEDLDALLTREVSIDPLRAVRFARQVTRGLGDAHRVGVIHRDLKPANVFVTTVGDETILKIVDFGMSKIDQAEPVTVPGVSSGPLQTGPGTFLGTPLYMAPEQVGSSTTVDGRADLYALGVMLYQMLSGRTPHDGRTLEILLAQKLTVDGQEVVHTLHGLPTLLGATVGRLLAIDPNSRPPDAFTVDAALAAVEGILAAHGPVAHAATAFSPHTPSVTPSVPSRELATAAPTPHAPSAPGNPPAHGPAWQASASQGATHPSIGPSAPTTPSPVREGEPNPHSSSAGRPTASTWNEGTRTTVARDVGSFFTFLRWAIVLSLGLSFCLCTAFGTYVALHGPGTGALVSAPSQPEVTPSVSPPTPTVTTPAVTAPAVTAPAVSAPMAPLPAPAPSPPTVAPREPTEPPIATAIDETTAPPPAMHDEPPAREPERPIDIEIRVIGSIRRSDVETVVTRARSDIQRCHPGHPARTRLHFTIAAANFMPMLDDAFPRSPEECVGRALLHAAPFPTFGGVVDLTVDFL